MNTPFLKGNNIYLRPLLESDINEDYVNWFNDPKVCKYNSHHVFPNTVEKTLEYVKRVSLSSTDIVLAIITEKNDAHIGNVALQKIDFINRNAEFAIIIGIKEYWNQGFSKEIAHLVMKHGFEELNLHRIYCGTSAENIPMQKLAESMGMQKEGVMRDSLFKNNTYIDSFSYGILKTDFV